MKRLGQAETDAEHAAEAALAAVPDWLGRRIRYAPTVAGVVSPIHRGVAAQCWTVAFDDDPPSLFLKVLHDDMRPFVDLETAFDAASKAAGAGCTPCPRRLLPAEGAIAFDLLPQAWDWARLHRLREPSIFERLVALKKTIHDGPAFARTRDVFAVVDDYAARAERTGAALPGDAWWLIETVREVGQAIRAAGFDRRPCHGDGVASNVMIGPGDDLLLVDFDRAANADPVFDLGLLLAEVCQFEDEECSAVELFAGRYDRRVHHRAKLYGAADDVAWGLWGCMLGAVSPRRSVEFVKYGEWRFLRARMTLHDPRFEAMLRHV